MPEKTKEVPKVFQMTLNHNQLHMIGMALSHMGAKLSLNLVGMSIQTRIMNAMIHEIGPDQFSEDLQAAIDQVAMLDGVPKCPKCGDFHVPDSTEDHDATGNSSTAN